MSRITDAVSTLQERLTQTVETVTRTSRIDFVSGSVDEIDPPEDLDEFADYAKNTGIVRKNLRKFVNDVWEPGYRLEGPDETVAYFMGEQEDLPSPPEQTPENGFLDNAAIYAGEKHQDFSHFAKECSWQRWVRGTVTVELLKAEPENPDSPIHGFNFIPPETLYPQVFANSNILLPPDPEDLPENFDTDGVETTKRGEIAAYIQFDDESIIGRRFGGIDADAVPLSQNDVKKQTLEPDIGNPRGTKNERGVFGSSILEAINEEIEEYKSFKRDWATAIKTKSNGLWTAQFNKEVDELPNGQVEITEWDTDDMDALTNEIDNSGPGDIVTHDGNIELDRLTGEVPELGPVLQHYVDEISAPLPAPKFMVGFADDINRDITKEQAPDYDQTVENEREFQSNWWTELLRFVARRNGLDAEGLEFIVGPEPSDNPIESLDQAEIKKIQTYAAALNELAGPKGGLTTLVDRETLLTEVAMLPESATGDMDTPEIEADAETQQEFEELFGLDAESLADAGEIDRTPPEAAQRAAQAVVDALESDEKETDALTDVGKKRARQLADGEELSNDVLSKMSQFARHQGNTEYANWSDVPESKKGAGAENPWYTDNGTVAWFAWGGESGVEWAQEQFDKVESAGVTYDVLAETVVDAESLGNRYSEGDVVQTPQGVGVVTAVWTSSWETAGGETVEAVSNSPTYTVALKDARVGFEHYKASQLSEGEIDTDVENPLSDVEAAKDIAAATEVEVLAEWDPPESWEKADTPARVIALDAWASMGGQFDCDGACCHGEMTSSGMSSAAADEFCASFKSYILGTENWRGWGPD